ncbi:MAG: PAC2 family protein [Candidatus Bathyarchaeota archaeon]|nr:PAC2 family protein [Candidatus Bathyarchaeota archaeon]
MNKTYIRLLSQQDFKSPTLIAGLPGIGNVGVTVIKLLVEFLDARLFAELYSPTLPDYTSVNSDGICSLLKCSFFASSERNLILLLGDAQPSVDDTPAYYELCGDILDFISGLGCKFIITVDGFPSTHPQNIVHVAGTSRDIIFDYNLAGAAIYTGGRIVGISGILLGLAKIRGIEGICLLSPVVDLVSDREAAFNAYRFLRRVLGLGIEKTID